MADGFAKVDFTYKNSIREEFFMKKELCVSWLSCFLFYSKTLACGFFRSGYRAQDQVFKLKLQIFFPTAHKIQANYCGIIYGEQLRKGG